ncbi:hypothetical protein, partial [Pseudomonas aeruginosa]|uniref:hypothetical protein n=1 Tax=Pseudomonas aeruginosa TaxID=287 RepID=UPI0019D618AC
FLRVMIRSFEREPLAEGRERFRLPAMRRHAETLEKSPAGAGQGGDETGSGNSSAVAQQHRRGLAF